MPLIMPTSFQPRPLMEVDPEILAAQGVHVLRAQLELGVLASAAAASKTSDLTVFEDPSDLRSDFESAFVDSTLVMLDELDELGYRQYDAVINTLGVYKEMLREAENLPQGTFVDRLHRDESFQPAIIVNEHPSWYYVNPDGKTFGDQDFRRQELSIGEGFNWNNLRVAPVGRWIFHTEQVAHCRPPGAVGSASRSTGIYRRFIEL